MKYRRKQSKTEITKKCKKTKSVLHAESIECAHRKYEVDTHKK